jgi:diguanylate cyclase (GGDEF)-like protein
MTASIRVEGSAAVSTSEAAELDRRRAAEDRRRAARYLAAAYQDDTTGAVNRHPGRDQMRNLLDRARRESSVLTFVFLDVDGLKKVNDSQGHGCGDALLAALGNALREELRSYDLVVRYGGDEFVCALPGASAQVAQNRMASVGSTLDVLVAGASFSAGYAELQDSDTLDDVVRRADSDLYARRRSGQGAEAMRPSPAPVVPADAQPASVACGACGNRISLTDFVLGRSSRMTRYADCPACGVTTVIELLHGVADSSAVPLRVDG